MRLIRMARLIQPCFLATVLVLALIGSAKPAHADFRLCNQTPSRVGIAIG